MGELRADIVLQSDGGVVVAHEQDVEPVLERAKELARSGQTRSREMLHLAEFPENIVMAYCQSKGITFQQFMQDREHVKNMLADPALRDFQIYANDPHKAYR